MTPVPAVALDSRFARELPELAVPWQAESTDDPRLLVLNDALASELGLQPEWLRTPEGLRFLVGNLLPESARPVAQAYAGHQFGGFVPRLGDGRALLLGELSGPDGTLRDVHLKGSGRTPFARGGDGLAAVGPMLREYIVSEAMHALGVPTTRSLAVVATGRPVFRDSPLPGAVLTRVASSHLRVGTFQYAFGIYRTTGDVALLQRLADHAIARHHRAAAGAANPYLALLESVVAVQAHLIARWMLIGFVHGVMNTDNMTISGETIDYGPCAFMDAFDPATVFSSIDEWGRYAYANQPVVAEWNLTRFAESLLPLIGDPSGPDGGTDRAVELAQEALAGFRPAYSAAWSSGMTAKIGLAEHVPADAAPVDELLALLQQERVDWTSFYRVLAGAARGEDDPVRSLFGGSPESAQAFGAWLDRWLALGPDGDAMDRVNPVYIPRNHLVEAALSAAGGDDLGPLHELLGAVTDPFRERPGLERFAQPAPADFTDYRTFCGT